MADKETSRVQLAYKLFFHAVREPGVDQILQAAHELFGCPVLFTDEFFRVSSLCPNHATGNEEWDYIVQHKMMDQARILAIMDEFLSGEKPFYKIFYANTGSCAELPRIMGELVREDAVYGHIFVFLGDTPLQDDDFEIVQLLLDAISIKIDSRVRGMSKWNLAMTTKLQDLLTSDTPPHLVDLACDILSKGILGDYAILATPIGPKASQKAFAEYAVSQLQQIYRNVISVIHNRVIVTLIGEVKSHGGPRVLRLDTNSFIQQIFQYFREHDLISGLSNRFSDIREVYPHYRQAELTARLAEETGFQEPAVFMDFMPLPMFSAALQQEDAAVFLHPSLMELKQYDQEHGTEYYETMRVFSLTMHNRDATADQLSIHRNTLLYRLNRISELFDLPYEDRKVGLNILCSYLLMECVEHNNFVTSNAYHWTDPGESQKRPNGKK
ncbi:MAG: helix-turn-helix domain-containing protein [Oscillospiraceae bacterium]|nr:helix-turn-helix domain-containing protein [Oscillospiraceae bacterium]